MCFKLIYIIRPGGAAKGSEHGSSAALALRPPWVVRPDSSLRLAGQGRVSLGVRAEGKGNSPQVEVPAAAAQQSKALSQRQVGAPEEGRDRVTEHRKRGGSLGTPLRDLHLYTVVVSR